MGENDIRRIIERVVKEVQGVFHPLSVKRFATGFAKLYIERMAHHWPIVGATSRYRSLSGFRAKQKRKVARTFSTLDGGEYNSATAILGDMVSNPAAVMIDLLFQALWILAFFRRRKTIGGPLLVFFVQLFVSVALSLVLITSVLFAWEKRDRSVPLPFNQLKFHLSLLILVMSFAAITATAIAGLALLKTRNWHHVVYVRAGLCAVAVLAIVNFTTAPNIANCLELIFPFVFVPYFFLSKRVRRAFTQPQPLDARV